MPSENTVRTIPEVVTGLGALSRSPLATFVSSSSRGPFDAATMMMNQIERDLPVKVDDHTGIHLGKQKTTVNGLNNIMFCY